VYLHTWLSLFFGSSCHLAIILCSVPSPPMTIPVWRTYLIAQVLRFFSFVLSYRLIMLPMLVSNSWAQTILLPRAGTTGASPDPERFLNLLILRIHNVDIISASKSHTVS
jgi:hypothetical protein